MNDINFPLDVNGYHFIHWKDTSKQLGYKDGTSMKNRYEKMKDTHSLEEIFVPRIIKDTIFPLDVNGYHFVSWLNAAKQLGYKNGTSMIQRYEKMKDTHSLEEIFVPRIIKDTIFPLDVNGYHFVSWRDAARQLNYSIGHIIKQRYERMKDTNTLEEIFVPKVEKDTIFPLDVNGCHFVSWEDAGKQLGYRKGTPIKSRYETMKETNSLEEIFVYRVHIKRHCKKSSLFPLDVNGYHFVSWEDASKQLGLVSIYGRYNQMKVTHSLEEIFVPKRHNPLFPLDVNGYHFVSWNDTAIQLGYTSGTGMQYHYLNMKDTHSLEEIFVPKGSGSIFPLDVNGYHFTSWKNAGIQLGYRQSSNIKNRYERMKDTHSLEEIFVPKGAGSIFPLDVNGYHFVSWLNAAKQLGYKSGTSMLQRYERMKDTHSLEEIFVPRIIEELIFPLNVNGYHFIGWTDAGKQLGYSDGTPIKQHYERMKDTHSLEEIFVPRIIEESIFPININGYYFVSWKDAARQLRRCETSIQKCYKKGYPLIEVFGFSIHLSDKRTTKINDNLICHSKISDNLYKCKNKKTKLFELHTYEELNEMWRKYKGVKIVKED